MTIQLKKIAIPLLLLLIFARMYGQQPKGAAAQQVSKGKWMISHEVLSVGHLNEKKKFSDGDNLTGSSNSNRFYTSLSLVSPFWGNMNFGKGKISRYDASDTEYEKEKSSNWSVGINPSIGYFISDRMMLGANMQIYFSNEKTRYTRTSGFQEYINDYTTLGIGPEFRYYFRTGSPKQLFYAGVSPNIIYRLNRQTTTIFTSGPNTTNKTIYKARQPEFTGRGYVGSAWFAGRHWAFTGGLASTFASDTYKLRSTDSNGSFYSKTKSRRLNLGLNAGLTYTL